MAVFKVYLLHTITPPKVLTKQTYNRIILLLILLSTELAESWQPYNVQKILI